MNSTQEAAPKVAVSTPKTRVTCPSCGQVRRSRADLKSPVCRFCRRIERDIDPLAPGDALIGGRWVGGLVKRWVLELIPWPAAPTLGVTCHCGCLLIHAEETCPSCMVAALGSSAVAERVAA